ncbi:MAG: hypothetical protein ABI836_05625, partial [Gemmatimonadota bacterium]
GSSGTLLGRGARDTFDHAKHSKLFPSCQSCHVGVREENQPVFPSSVSCAECHDGQVEKRVDWEPPVTPHPTNLRFTHARHDARLQAGRAADSVLACVACHSEKTAGWMQVRRTVSRECFDCHGHSEPHLAVPDSACATCHLPLTQAIALSRETVAAFPAPESHQAPDFAFAGHGPLVKSTIPGVAVAASCATCHARDFCITCHVDAPEQRSIQALGEDPRSLAIATELKAPPNHGTAGFLNRHGSLARGSAQECRTCHTRESCITCHVQAPVAARGLASAGPGRGKGAQVTRSRPVSHGADFRDAHAALAQASPRSCATCHARAECLDCHRPTAAAVGGYHPAGFLTRHPVAAYARETSCADCHSTTAFCAACHQQSGLTAQKRLGSGFHDGKNQFLFGHGQAARQNLETCVSCHAERDCLVCHAASGVGGRGFNPHGPGFDAARMKRKNPETCTACHGVSIP